MLPEINKIELFSSYSAHVQKLIYNQPEITGLTKIDWNTHPGQKTTWLCDRAVQLLTAKVYVFSDSVLCLGKIKEPPEAVKKWEEQMKWFSKTP